jgi:hypothetical protein
MALKQLGRNEEAAVHLEVFRRGQQQATDARRTQMARDVLREAQKLTGAVSAPASKGAAR